MKMIEKAAFISCFIVYICLVGSALGHGYLSQPAGRSSAWRNNFPTPINYNDNSLYCGGFAVSVHLSLYFTITMLEE